MTTRPIVFDFTSSVEKQVADLSKSSFYVRAVLLHPTYIAISDEV